jgi:hypothetical protein
MSNAIPLNKAIHSDSVLSKQNTGHLVYGKLSSRDGLRFRYIKSFKSPVLTFRSKLQIDLY